MHHIDPLQLAHHLADAPALAGDPRPGTRDLADTALGVLGIELLRCDEQAVAARMPLTSPHAGRGLLLVLAESVASTAAGIRARRGRRAFGAELNASWTMAPAAGDVIAVATELAIGRERHVWRIVAVDASGSHVLESRCTLGVVDAPA